MTIKQMLSAEIGCTEAQIERALDMLLAQIWLKRGFIKLYRMKWLPPTYSIN